MRHPRRAAARQRFGSLLAAFAAAILLLAVSSPLAAAPCGHPNADEPPAVAPTSVAAWGPAVHPPGLPAAHCGHCSPATCAAAVSCGQSHARPAGLHHAFAAETTRCGPAADRPGIRSTGPPPETPPPQRRS